MKTERFAELDQRFFAWFIDMVIVFTLASMLHWSLGDPLGAASTRIPHFGSSPMILLVIVLYYWIFEGSSRQATPGKLAFGLRVSDDGGKRLSWKRALARSLLRLLSFASIVGVLVALITKKSQALHDLIAATVVVVEQDAESA